MTIIFFTKGDRSFASSRVRVHIVADHLRRMGIKTQVYVVSTLPWWRLSRRRFSELLRNIRVLAALNKDEVLYVHKTVAQVDFVLLILFFRIMLRKKYIFDFDDAIYLYAGFKTRLLTRFASRVVVGGHQLQTYAQLFNPHVSLVPTAIDVTQYTPKEGGTPDVKTIGWIGNPDPKSLEILVEPLKELLRKGLSFRLRLVGVSGDERIYDLFRLIPGLNVDFIDHIDWTNTQNNVDAIHSFSIGVAPLIDSAWSRGKCGFKAIECMGCAVPVVASKVGELPHIISDGKNGFTAESPGEWAQKLERLLRDDSLARDMGMAGRNTVIEKYSYQVTIPRIKDIVWSI